VRTLQENKDELVKNCQIVPLHRLSETECKELLRRRLLFGKKLMKEIENTPNYSIDLQPFTESTVATIAQIAEYNPLKFIQKLKLAVLCARENKYELIDERCVQELLKKEKPEIKELFNLTPRQREVLDFVKLYGPVTTEDVRKHIKVTSRVTPFLLLQKLVEKGTIAKDKKGKLAFYNVINPNQKNSGIPLPPKVGAGKV
jgi:uncharacterized membrane protein